MATHSGILVHYKHKGAWLQSMTERLSATTLSTVHLKGKIFTVISSIHIVRARTIPSLSYPSRFLK